MKMKTIRRAATVFLSGALAAASMPMQPTAADSKWAEPVPVSISVSAGLKEAVSFAAFAESSQVSRVSVHDPSIIKADGTYYLFGTHLADAKSSDLINWTQMNPDWNARGGGSWKQDCIWQYFGKPGRILCLGGLR